MNNIKAIGFDCFGVLMAYQGPSIARLGAQHLNIAEETFRTAYYQHNHLVNKGDNSKMYKDAGKMWGLIFEKLGKSDRLESFMELLQEQPEPIIDVEMLGLVAQLKALDYKIGFLSNFSADGSAWIRNRVDEDLFDTYLISAEINTMKPEPSAFKHLANGLGVKMEELVFIDDSTRSLSSSQELGFHPLLFKNKNQLVADLANLGIKIESH